MLINWLSLCVGQPGRRLNTGTAEAANEANRPGGFVSM